MARQHHQPVRDGRVWWSPARCHDQGRDVGDAADIAERRHSLGQRFEPRRRAGRHRAGRENLFCQCPLTHTLPPSASRARA